MTLIKLYITILLLLTYLAGNSQDKGIYNINRHNGLPSNHVYCMLTDNLGYMWIGTDNGLVRYNGYNFVKYNISNGLCDADVWDLRQDSKDRIWLSRISDEFGYMYNNQYHKVHFDPKEEYGFYPRHIREVDSSIHFFTMYRNIAYSCEVRGDSLTSQVLLNGSHPHNHYLDPDGNNYYIKDSILYSITITDTGCAIKKIDKLTRYRVYDVIGYDLVPRAGTQLNTIYIYDIRERREVDSILLGEQETVYNHYQNKNRYYIVTNKSISIKNGIEGKYHTYPISSFMPETQLENNLITYIIKDSFWPTSIGTTMGGLNICYNPSKKFKQKSIHLERFKHVGKDNEQTNYWWNNATQTFAVLDSNDQIRFRHYGDVNMLSQVSENAHGELCILANNNIYTLNKKNLDITPAYDTIATFAYQSDDDTAISQYSTINSDWTKLRNALGAQAGVIKDTCLYVITRGHGYTSYTLRNDTLYKRVLKFNRYDGILYAPTYNCNIVYNKNNIILHFRDTIITVDKSILSSSGIIEIKKILFDNQFGNIFIVANNKIFCYNAANNKFIEVLRNYKLDEPLADIHEDVLMIACRSGVIFLKINGVAFFSEPIFSPNTKGLLYNSINDITSSNNRALLNTDRGLLYLSIPDFNNINAYTQRTKGTEKHKLVIAYGKEMRTVHSGDTIKLEQDNPLIQFDLIKPTGVGSPYFKYRIEGLDKKWKLITGNELYVGEITIGQYYPMKLRAEDDVWKSPDVQLYIYIIPTFWQTAAGKRTLAAIIMVISLCIIFLIVYLTRKIVSAAHIRHNQMLSLKLKSVYAQINPHFIFNTLNTGLYFIKENMNKEAYTHISSFSELLRAYIKSSRKNYTTLSEEIKNLENYIKLQQYRFEDAFDYSIHTGANIDIEHISIPAMLLQPFAENAINHGLIHKEKKGHLSIRIFSDNPEKEITCEIEDDGIGRKKSAELNENNPYKSDSYGNDLISDLIKLINTDDRVHVSIEYIDKQYPDTGTIVVISIKITNHDT